MLLTEHMTLYITLVKGRHIELAGEQNSGMVYCVFLVNIRCVFLVNIRPMRI